MKDTKQQPNGSPDEIKAGIENTRAQMEETMDALTDRLRPRHLLDDVIDYFRSRRASGADDGQRVKEAASHLSHRVKETAGDTGRTIVRQVKRHPIPSLLIGAGLAWLLMESEEEQEGYAELYSEEAAEQYYEQLGGRPEGAAHELLGSGPEAKVEGYALPAHYAEDESEEPGMLENVKNKSADIMEKARDKGADLKARAGEGMRRMKSKASRRTDMLRNRAGEMGTELKQHAQHTYEESIDGFKRTADEHPLAVGAGFLALGVLAGILLPSTRKEDEIIGPTRDRLVHRTREAAEEAVERGKQVAYVAADAARSEAREQGLTGEALREKGAHVVQAAQAAAQQEGITPGAIKDKAQIVAAETKEAARHEAQKQSEQFPGT